MAAASDKRKRDTGDERYQRLIELSPDGILVHDGQRVILANSSAVALAGATTPAQLVGLPIDTLLDPPFLKAVETELTHAAGPAMPAPPVRDTIHRLDGVELPVEVRAVPFLDHGQPSAELIIRDITGRLAVEEAARQQEERHQHAHRLETVGVLAGGVAHEVNNMLQVIQGFSDLLIDRDDLPPECVADVQQIMNATGRAASITRQLLDFGRRATHLPQAVELEAVLHRADPVVRRLLGKEQELVVAGGTNHRVWVDPGQLQQVVINLALNARDAMPDEGTLTLCTEEADLPAAITAADGMAIPAGHYATLIVRDTGAGMDAATAGRIFEPFFTTKPLGRGTGLGLSAAHGIITQNQGFITVASTPGRGTTFTVYLPILPATPEPLPIESPIPAVGIRTHAGATILLVEDEPAVRTVTARILERDGFHVRKALSASEALELVDRTGPPDLVLTDLRMHGMDGAELARRLAARWPALPIICMSGDSADELHRQGMLDAGQDLLQKPFTPERLIARVSDALTHAGLARQTGA